MLNNYIKYNIIKLTLTKIIYNFKIKKFFNMLNNSITSIKFIILKALNRFNETLRNLITFIVLININIITTFVIDYRLIHINIKNVINFASMKIKSYYDKHY